MSRQNVQSFFVKVKVDKPLKNFICALTLVVAFVAALFLASSPAFAESSTKIQCMPQAAFAKMVSLLDAEKSTAALTPVVRNSPAGKWMTKETAAPQSNQIRNAQGPERCCCLGCENSTLPRCSFCS